MSSIGARTAFAPHNCEHGDRPKYLTKKYCGNINFDSEDECGTISCCLVFDRTASGVNGIGRSLLLSLEIIFKFLKS